MKWTLVGLMLLGLIAAVSASVLMAGLRGQPKIIQLPAEKLVGDVEVILAARDMGALTVVDHKSIRTKVVPADQAPEGFINGTAQAIGNVLTISVVQGQALTVNCFAKPGTAVSLASALPEGMRAVTLSLSASAALAGLAYPGCVVDVLFSFGVSGPHGDQPAEAISITLLQGVEVLAIDHLTVFSPAQDPAQQDLASQRGRQRLVTVMVDPGQAKALQLAMKYGALSLALRNPLDARKLTPDHTRLSSLSDDYSGFLRQLAALTDSSVPSDASGSVKPPVARVESEAAGDDAAAQPLLWDTTIIRGEQIETRSFPWPDDQAEG